MNETTSYRGLYGRCGPFDHQGVFFPRTVDQKALSLLCFVTSAPSRGLFSSQRSPYQPMTTWKKRSNTRKFAFGLDWWWPSSFLLFTCFHQKCLLVSDKQLENQAGWKYPLPSKPSWWLHGQHVTGSLCTHAKPAITSRPELASSCGIASKVPLFVPFFCFALFPAANLGRMSLVPWQYIELDCSLFAAQFYRQADWELESGERNRIQCRQVRFPRISGRTEKRGEIVKRKRKMVIVVLVQIRILTLSIRVRLMSSAWLLTWMIV